MNVAHGMIQLDANSSLHIQGCQINYNAMICFDGSIVITDFNWTGNFPDGITLKDLEQEIASRIRDEIIHIGNTMKEAK